MTREEAIKKWIVPAIGWTWNEKRCKEIIKALEQEPCEDCISREKTMQIVRKWFDRDAAPSDLKNEIEQLPSVPPKQRTGWIPCSERLPERDGEYLVTITDVIGKPMIRMRSFAKNLKKVDPYDFVNAKGCGWYDYDSEVGHWRDTDVKAWMEFPKPYRANRTGAEGSNKE